MKIRRWASVLVASVVAVCAAFVLIASAAASGGATALTMKVTGSPVEPGGTLTVQSITPCEAKYSVDLYLRAVQGEGAVAANSFPTLSDGSWAGTLHVPVGTPGGDYEVTAFCTERGHRTFTFAPVPVTIAGQQTATTATTTGVTTAPTSTAPAASVAPASSSKPSYTG